jgi:hypothetical protein
VTTWIYAGDDSLVVLGSIDFGDGANAETVYFIDDLASARLIRKALAAGETPPSFDLEAQPLLVPAGERPESWWIPSSATE